MYHKYIKNIFDDVIIEEHIPGKNHVIKSVSSSISHKKTLSVNPSFRDFSSFLSSAFIFKLILIKISTNANIEKTQIFHFIKYDLNLLGQIRFTAYFSFSLFALFLHWSLFYENVFTLFFFQKRGREQKRKNSTKDET